jgi:hypothetical protein
VGPHSSAPAIPGSDEPEGSLTRAIARASRDDALRGAIVMSPARFQFSRVFVSVGSLRIITPLRVPGLRFDVAFGFIELGFRV